MAQTTKTQKAKNNTVKKTLIINTHHFSLSSDKLLFLYKQQLACLFKCVEWEILITNAITASTGLLILPAWG